MSPRGDERRNDMADYIEKSACKVDRLLVDFVETGSYSGHRYRPRQFWGGSPGWCGDFTPRNRELLAIRDRSCRRRSTTGTRPEWAGGGADPARYQAFLKEIGYLVAEPADFTIETERARPGDRLYLRARSWWCRCRMRAMR